MLNHNKEFISHKKRSISKCQELEIGPDSKRNGFDKLDILSEGSIILNKMLKYLELWGNNPTSFEMS